jgi:hypothetical protein
MDKEQRALNLADDLSAAISKTEIDLTAYMPGESHEMTAPELREHVAGIVRTVRGFHDPTYYDEATLPRIVLRFGTSIARDQVRVFASDDDSTWQPVKHDIDSMVQLFRKEWSDRRMELRRGPSGQRRWTVGEEG